ncbi:MAG: AAA family ATPase, partial [Candidatus Nanopelagicaceae bacterium]
KVEFIREQLAPKGGNLTPGDDYNSKVTWDEILEPLGWKKIYTNKAGVTSWRRPGKNEGGISATTNHAGNDKFYVFSSSTQFEAQRSYSKFAIYTIVEHQGDFTAAARALRSQGYGAAIELPSLGQSALAEAMSVPVKSALEIELDKQRTRREAAAIIKEEEASKTYKEPIFVRSLKEELQLPEIEAQWVIRDIFPQGANISITAQYKAGKTTLINDLARSLSDGTKFLDYFQEPVHSRRIVIFNYEVSANQYRRWMKDVDVKHSDDITLVHLRGERLPMISEKVQRLMISILKDLDCQTWILDPFARAFVGSGDENSNSDVSLFLDTLDYIKKQANIDNLVLPMHTGRAQEHGIERARGATRLDDWADVRWLLSKTEEGRFFAADGRDVFLEQQALAFDEASRRLKLGG